ncbi:Phosphoglycolate phosphatase [Roseivivax jejudonensis]|uniref:phosphoglycolate phosphatase n=1 Tax=Roseivivax jejudonensis TaxID=1529041 RepID=A0A1X6Z7I2_9RHOB|nr:HAD-IA family hydrolase [Roseivivax jejudonensis]SLN42884.1 Phosphoglycolate phosphatase [Roseivivax jejudonensis]
MRTVIFDLDGTLADTSGDLIAAANRCFEDMGASVRLDPAADAAIAFRGGRAMLRAGLARAEGGGVDEAIVDRWYPTLLDAYGAAIDVHTILYPGAMDAVEALRDGGAAVAICTNKPEALAETLLSRLGVRDRFAALIGADTLPVRKPDPAPYRAAVERAGGHFDRSLIVGDTETDRATARAVGRPCILVGFGPEGADVARHDPEAIIGHYDELGGTVDRLLGAA